MADEAIQEVIQVGPRLRALRQQRGATLRDLAEETGISVSTLSRLESGQRRPTLEQLLPLARAHRVSLDELVDAPATGDPRVQLRAVRRHGRTFLPLTRRPGGLQAYKMCCRPSRTWPPTCAPTRATSGSTCSPGSCGCCSATATSPSGPARSWSSTHRTPHWVGNPGPHPTEALALFGPQGERMHVR